MENINLKKGNTIPLSCSPETLEQIEKLVFAINDNIRKIYKSDGTGDIKEHDGTLYINLTQEETLSLKDKVALCEVAILTKNDERIGSNIISCKVLDTIITEEIKSEPTESL